MLSQGQEQCSQGQDQCSQGLEQFFYDLELSRGLGGAPRIKSDSKHYQCDYIFLDTQDSEEKSEKGSYHDKYIAFFTLKNIRFIY